MKHHRSLKLSNWSHCQMMAEIKLETFHICIDRKKPESHHYNDNESESLFAPYCTIHSIWTICCRLHCDTNWGKKIMIMLRFTCFPDVRSMPEPEGWWNVGILLSFQRCLAGYLSLKGTRIYSIVLCWSHDNRKYSRRWRLEIKKRIFCDFVWHTTSAANC